MAKITKLGLLLGAGIIILPASAMAGFEFTGPKTEPLSSVGLENNDSAMPVVPAGEVSAEPLAPVDAGLSENAALPQGPSNDAILSAPATAQKSSGEQVYIRRQRTAIPLKAGANEPVNTKALLDATENRQPLSIVPKDGSVASQLPSAETTNTLKINPRPLEDQATHGSGMGAAPLEQAMLEEGGSLRPVAVPGRHGEGLRQRARITSRYDSETEYLPRTQNAEGMDNAAVEMSSLTPLPGQDTAVESEKLPARTFAAAPAETQNQPLPLQPVSQQAPVPRPPETSASSQSASNVPPQQQAAETRVMPRPAVPQNALTAQPSGAQPAGEGQFSEAIGFGRDLPLALALSQVVPPEYSYAFGQNVNVGSTVSWQGGKPWNEVLNEMLAPSGMTSVIQNGQVTIIRKS